MAALQMEQMSDEWFQQLSALIDAHQAATVTTSTSLASGIQLDCFVLGFLHSVFTCPLLMSGSRLFLLNLVSVSRTTSNDHSTSTAGDLRHPFLATNCEAFACPAPRREPETIQLEEGEEGEDARQIREEGLPKPNQVGNCLFKCELPTRNAIFRSTDNVDA